MVHLQTVKAVLQLLSYYDLSIYLEAAKRKNYKTLIELAINEIHYRADLLIPDHKLFNDLTHLL